MLDGDDLTAGLLGPFHEHIFGNDAPVIVDMKHGQFFLAEGFTGVPGHKRPFARLGPNNAKTPWAARRKAWMGGSG